MSTPTIPHGYRLVSGPHTAAEVEEGWTICADWTHWDARPNASRDDLSLRAYRGGKPKLMCYLDDPERDIYRIEKVSP